MLPQINFGQHCGAVASIVTLQQEGPRFHLGLSGWSLYVLVPLWVLPRVLQLSPTVQKHASQANGPLLIVNC